MGLAGACWKGHKEIAELMITKGANDFNRGLCEAYYGDYKEIILFMIIKGAAADLTSSREEYNIKDFLKLDFEDIYYLLHNGVKNFGKFDNLAHECKKWKIEFKNVANELFIKDVANIIVEF